MRLCHSHLCVYISQERLHVKTHKYARIGLNYNEIYVIAHFFDIFISGCDSPLFYCSILFLTVFFAFANVNGYKIFNAILFILLYFPKLNEIF